MKPIMFILCGLPGAGKSTFRNTFLSSYLSISRDYLRYAYNISESEDDKKVGTKEQEDLITKAFNYQVDAAIKCDKSCVLDNMNNKKYRPDLIRPFKKAGYTIIGVNFKTSLEICKERRKDQISGEVMDKIASNFHYIEQDEVDMLYNIL
jgi:predicted kinase